MAVFKTNVMRLLDQKKVPYTAREYPHGDEAVDGVTVARLLNLPVESVFKTLVTKGAKGGYYVFVVPVAKELNLKMAAKAVGEKSVEMIHVKELLPLTGYVRGGCSPLGMKKAFPTVIDSSACERSTIMVSAGKIGYQVELDPFALQKLSGASFAPIVSYR